MNKAKTMNNKLKTLSVILFVLIGIAAISYPLINFEGTSAANGENDNQSTACVKEMTPFIKEKSSEFRSYLETHFSNKSKNTTLIEAAILKYKLVEKEINDKLLTYTPQSGQSLTAETTEQINCARIVNEELELMKDLMKRYAIKTNQIKVTSGFQQKMADINKKLSDLDKQFTLMLGKYETLSNRFPCYAKQCIN